MGLRVATGGWIDRRPTSVTCVFGPFERGAGVIGRDGGEVNFLAGEKKKKKIRKTTFYGRAGILKQASDRQKA